MISGNLMELWNSSWPAAVIMLGLASAFALVLLVASEKLKVKTDPKIEQIHQALPQIDCGACGYAGCTAYAKAIVGTGISVTICTAIGNEISAKIAKIAGTEAEEGEESYVAKIRCLGDKDTVDKIVNYKGIRKCSAVYNTTGGNKACAYGCLGYGDCEEVCPFDAIYVKENGLPEVDEDKCTGCGLCVKACPAHKKVDGVKTDKKAINMVEQAPLRKQEVENWDFFLTLPLVDRNLLKENTLKGSQLLEPLFEFSGACAGCGETPYVKLVSQLFGDRMIIANATGCSSIYGGNLPTTPYTTRADGRGPTWSNSLFEDAAEFGMGMRLTSDKMNQYALELVDKYIAENKLDTNLLNAIKNNPQSVQSEIEKQRENVSKLKDLLAKGSAQEDKNFLSVTDFLIKRSVWSFGGDGWAYDIGYGGLDHVLASGKNINILCVNTEVYSNTGGQMSKATPVGAIAKFAAGGKPIGKKDLGLMIATYGYVYVAQIAMGANKVQTIKAIVEAENYDGPSLIIAYSHCIAHGFNLVNGLDQQKLAVDSGAWNLFRYNPVLAAEGKNPFILDSKEPTAEIKDYMYNENRFKALKRSKPDMAEKYLQEAKKSATERYNFYKYLADI